MASSSRVQLSATGFYRTPKIGYDRKTETNANGDTVLVYRKPEMGGGSANNTNPGVLVPGKPITGGSISLQAETAEIDFRKVEILNLEGCMDPKSKSYRAYFIKHDPAACK